MTEHDKPNFAKLMMLMAELYNKKMSKAFFQFYWEKLQRFDYADVEAAINLHTDDGDVGQYVFKPCDVTRYVDGTLETQALRAYSKVESAIRHLGSYTSVAFDDPRIHAVICDMGGWVKYCCCKESQLGFQQNEFIKRYRGYAQGKLSRYPSYLRGIAEHSNTMNGYLKNPLPALIGDLEKAKLVMQSGKGSTVLIHQNVLEVGQILKQLENIPMPEGKQNVNI